MNLSCMFHQQVQQEWPVRHISRLSVSEEESYKV